jgi:hypothetical protein
MSQRCSVHPVSAAVHRVRSMVRAPHCWSQRREHSLRVLAIDPHVPVEVGRKEGNPHSALGRGHPSFRGLENFTRSFNLEPPLSGAPLFGAKRMHR